MHRIYFLRRIAARKLGFSERILDDIHYIGKMYFPFEKQPYRGFVCGVQNSARKPARFNSLFRERGRTEFFLVGR